MHCLFANLSAATDQWHLDKQRWLRWPSLFSTSASSGRLTLQLPKYNDHRIFRTAVILFWLNTCLVVVVQLIFINRQRYFPFPCKLFSINRHSLHQRNPTSRSTVTSWIEIWKIGRGRDRDRVCPRAQAKSKLDPPYFFNQERMLYVEVALLLGHSTKLLLDKN